MTTAYSYGNIVRVLNLEEDFSQSRMVDVNIEDGTILSEFDAGQPFDAAFIQSYLNILNESKVGFRTLSDSPEDVKLLNKALVLSRLA